MIKISENIIAGKNIMLLLIFLYCTSLFSFHNKTGDTTLTKSQEKEIKRMSAEIRGQWWLLNKKCVSPLVIQETRLKTQVVTDTSRPLLRIEFKKKAVVIIHDYPYMKAANGKTGLWEIKCKKSEHSSLPDQYYLELSDEVKNFLGITGGNKILFRWEKKHLVLTDESKCSFEFRAD